VYLAKLRKQIEELGLPNMPGTDPQTGKAAPTMERPEGGSPEGVAPIPAADKPGFEGEGGYVYDVDDATKAIKILKSPRSAGGQSVTPGSPAYAAIAKELNDKYQLGLDVPTPKPAPALTFSTEADKLRDMNPQQRAEYEATGRLDSAKEGGKPYVPPRPFADRVAADELVDGAALRGATDRAIARGQPPMTDPKPFADRVAEGTLVNGAALAGVRQREEMKAPPPRVEPMAEAGDLDSQVASLNPPIKPFADRVADGTLTNNAALAGTAQRTQASLAGQKPADSWVSQIASGQAPPLAPSLVTSLKRLGFPGDAAQGITPDLVDWLSALPDAKLYEPTKSLGNALEMIKAIASSSTGVTSKDYGRPNGQPIM
jgi:hypothetical protein